MCKAYSHKKLWKAHVVSEICTVINMARLTESVRLYNAKSQLVTYAVFVKSSTYNIKSIQNDNAYSFKVCA